MGGCEDGAGYFAEVHDRVAAHAEGAERQEAADDDLARRELVQRQALVVHDQDDERERDAHAPHDVGRDERAERVLGVWQDLGDLGAGAGGDDRRRDGQELARGDAVEGRLVLGGHGEDAEGEGDGYGGCCAEDPEREGDGGGPGPPGGDADEDPHLDEGGEAHGDGAEEEGVGGVGEHDVEDGRVEGVAGDGEGEGEGEEEGVEAEEDYREVVQPAGGVGDGDEEDRDDARAHGYGEP